MAKTYTILAANRTVLVRSQTLVEDVEEVHVVTKPSGVTFVRAVPYKRWEEHGAAAALLPIVEHIEHIMAVRPHVVSGAAIQQIDQSGLISNAVEFVVRLTPTDTSQPGPFTSSVIIPVQVLHDHDSFDAYFEPVIAALTATANE